MQVDYDKYKEEDFTCKHCGWQGKGAELSYGDFSELHCICDLDCPKCHEHIGFWQAPLIDKKNNENQSD